MITTDDIWPAAWRSMTKLEKKRHIENMIERVLDEWEAGRFAPQDVARDTLRRALSDINAGLYDAAPWTLANSIHPDCQVNAWPNPNSRPSDLHTLTLANFRRALEHARREPEREFPVFRWTD